MSEDIAKDINRDILSIVASLSNEYGIDKEIVFQAMEEALASVIMRRFPDEEVDIRVVIDRKTGHSTTYRRWTVVDEEDYEFSAKQIKLSDAKEEDAGLAVNDVIEEQIESDMSGRIAAQQTKQFFKQKMRQAVRHEVVKFYEKKLGSMVVGQVKRVTYDHVIVDLGKQAEAVLKREHMIPHEIFRVNDRIRVFLYEVNEERKGPQLLVSRTHPGFLIELFGLEVPEIGQDILEIKAAARDPGVRAKIAVKTNDGRIDPIGACVGMRGARVQAISNELNGERVDIALWDDDPAKLVINVLAPAEVLSIVVDEETHAMDVAVKEDNLSQVIGRNGQNIRLAAELTGWRLNAMSEEELAKKSSDEAERTQQELMDKLNVDKAVAEVLAQAGFARLEDIAYAAAEDFKAIEGFDEASVSELQQRASQELLTQEIAYENEQAEAVQLDQELLNVEGMSTTLAQTLAGKGVVTRDDLADQSVDELLELVEMDEQAASKLIMAARAHWFEK